MSDPAAAKPTICLNMIVRNEAHIVTEVLDATAPYISSWVIVDTGSADGTQQLIRDHMARLGIPGDLYERPWRDFGHNRTEALALAQGRADYIWVIDADDDVVGTPDFTGLTADIYALRISQGSSFCWRAQLFRDGLPVRYEGVVHEFIVCDEPYVEVPLEGDYSVESRRLGDRNRDARKYARDRDLLLAEVERNPGDTRSVFYLAQSYFDLEDYPNARAWYARRAEMGGWDEEAYLAMFRTAVAMQEVGASWRDIQDAFLRAWEFRPTRAEPLYALARAFRQQERYQLGYAFATLAAGIPLPKDDRLFVYTDVYAWRAIDEQAVCADWIGKPAESFTLCRRLLARADLPEDERQRIAGNRDFTAPAMIEAAAAYPEAAARSLVAGPRDAEVTVSLLAGPDPTGTELTLNSLLQCCLDIGRVGRFLVLNTGLTAADRATLGERYRFVEFVDANPADHPGTQLARIRAEVGGRFWLHLGSGWRFFAPENYLTRLTAVLHAESDVVQVGVNFADSERLLSACAAEESVRRAPETGRYVLSEAPARGPALFDTARLDRVGGIAGGTADPLPALGRAVAAAGMRTATLDEVLCLAAVPGHAAV